MHTFLNRKTFEIRIDPAVSTSAKTYRIIIRVLTILPAQRINILIFEG